jgi:sigma-B regulation protein RsbU (phosphoserine phosphatase)
LLPVIGGIAVGFVLGFILVEKLIGAFPFVTICFFVGLMLGATPLLFREIKAEKVTPKRAGLFSIGVVIPIVIAIGIDLILRAIFKIDYLPFFTIFGWQMTIFMLLSNLLKTLTTSYVKNITLKRDLYSRIQSQTAELSEKNEILTNQIRIINADLLTATSVQQGFLPPKNIIFENWEIAIAYLPVENVSGDLYDYYTTENILNGISLFDVSGHGTSAGLLTMLSKNIISQNFENGIKNKLTVSQILKNINDDIVQQKSYSDKYLTGVLFNFDKNINGCIKGTMTSAGHPAPILYSAKNNRITELKTINTENQFGVIGFKDFDVSFVDVEFETYPEDVIVMFTDGITESKNKDGIDFGKESLISLLQRYSFHSPQKMLEIILESLNNFVGNIAVKDDITLVIMKRKAQ